MKKIISIFIILAFIFPCTAHAFTGEGTFDMAYSFSENGFARIVKGDKWGIINTAGKSVLAAEYDYIDELEGDLIKFKKDGLYGFLDSSFCEVISPAYTYAEDFSYGYAPVADESGKWGFISKDGKAICDFIYDEAYSFSDGLARVLKDGKYGYINTNGELEILPEYTESYDFSCGLACISFGGKYGYIDKNGEIKISAQYDGAWDFCENLAAVKAGELWHFIDTSGNIKISGNYDRATRFSDGLAPVRLSGGKYGLIDTSGKLVIAHKYDYISSFSNGLAFVRIDEKYGYINTAGMTVVPLLFDRAASFSQGYAAVGIAELCGYIDKSGTYVVNPEYFDAGSFNCGLANVKFENGLWGYIDLNTSVDATENNSSDFSFDIISNNASVIKLKIGDPTIIINGESSNLSVSPEITDGRTLLPIRAIVEAAGGTVSWEEQTQKVTVLYDGGSIVMQIGSTVAKVNGLLTPLEVAPSISAGSTMLPLRFIAETLGMGITWIADTSEILLYF